MTHALVLGASGLVGGHVVQGLVARGCAVRCAGRRPREGWVRFDLTDPATFGPALAGVDRVFLVARPGDDAPQVVAAPLIEAMARAGVAHVVNLSAMGAELRPEFGLRKAELLLEASGMAFTHLRPNWFMQVFTVPPLGPLLAATGTLALPAGDARLSFVDARDVADVAVAALLEERLRGTGLTLTGPEALDHEAAVREIARATGRPFRYHAQTDDEARAALSRSFDPARVERLVGFYRLVRAGACAPVTSDVERATGRPARRFAPFCDEHRAAWYPPHASAPVDATMGT